MSASADAEAFDAPALRPQDWRRPPSTGLAGRRAPRQSRAEVAADQLMAKAEAAVPGERLGAMQDLRAQCDVSVGTFNEAVRIAQSRGVVSVRPGPGGGVFAALQSPMVRLGNYVLALDADQTSVAQAVRIRDALEPLLIDDASWHACPADVSEMRVHLADMAAAIDRQDVTAFVYANWSLRARIAEISPHAVLRSLYLSLIEQIESHALAAIPVGQRSLPEDMATRHARYEAIVDALNDRDRELALSLITQQATSAVLNHSAALNHVTA